MATYCDYYYYTSSFFSVKGYCKRKEELGYRDSSVSSDEEDRYCSGYTSYRDCPVYNSSSGSACILTQTLCYYKGLSDRCGLMMQLREFREKVKRMVPDGESLISSYYEISNKTVPIIESMPKEKRDIIYATVFTELIMPCEKLIKSNCVVEAIELFKSFVMDLTSVIDQQVEPTL